MLAIPNLILIGATGRRLGETELACDLIAALAARTDVFGVRATIIREGEMPCPRGCATCGVCTSLDTHWHIEEERDAASRKGTGRMLAAGATRALWLKVAEAHVEEGVAAMLGELGAEGVIIAESNTLRRWVEPGLFVMVEGEGEPKPTAAKVIGLADRRVRSAEGRVNVDVEALVEAFPR